MTLDPNPHINKARYEIDNLRLSIARNLKLSEAYLDRALLGIDNHLTMAQAIIADQKVSS